MSGIGYRSALDFFFFFPSFLGRQSVFTKRLLRQLLVNFEGAKTVLS